ncbi:hypothetical protein VPHD479_0242 [Vibrio phage D479]
MALYTRHKTEHTISNPSNAMSWAFVRALAVAYEENKNVRSINGTRIISSRVTDAQTAVDFIKPNLTGSGSDPYVRYTVTASSGTDVSIVISVTNSAGVTTQHQSATNLDLTALLPKQTNTTVTSADGFSEDFKTATVWNDLPVMVQLFRSTLSDK